MSLDCRAGCGACCIAPSISSLIPDVLTGQCNSKPAGVRCAQLDDQERCRLFGDARRPAVCGQLQPSIEMCGTERRAAMAWLTALELATAPEKNQALD